MLRLRYCFSILLFFVLPLFGRAQTTGCKDPAATNYNPAATVADSSCSYNPTSYTPPVKITLSSTLNETSGLQWAGNSLWTFNDGGGVAAIYRIDTSSNTIQQTVTLAGTTNVDWEDIAFDGTSFYVGDFGNNNTGTRTDLKIYKFPLSAISSDYTNNPSVTVPSNQIEVINFSYSDQTDFSKDTANYTRFDCEAVIVDGGKIHLFTKNWIDLNTTHYVINGTAAGTYVATPIETLPTGYLVTAADKSPNGNFVILLGYQASGFGNHFLHLLSDFHGGFYFNGNRRKINLPSALTMGQAEGITFLTNTYGFISNEAVTGFGITPKLRTFNTEGFTPLYVLPVDLMNFSVKNQNEQRLISWQFAQTVSNLQLLYSKDGVSFTTLQNLGNQSMGSVYHASQNTSDCYRLSWQVDGKTKYSSIVCVNQAAKEGLRNLVLTASGQLNFLSDESDRYVFRLMTTDGRQVGQTVQTTVSVGVNTISFSKPLPNGSVLLLQAIGNKGQTTVLLKVQP